jgi:hypothetical protein
VSVFQVLLGIAAITSIDKKEIAHKNWSLERYPGMLIVPTSNRRIYKTSKRNILSLIVPTFKFLGGKSTGVLR